jgi:hypothetical protein
VTRRSRVQVVETAYCKICRERLHTETPSGSDPSPDPAQNRSFIHQAALLISDYLYWFFSIQIYQIYFSTLFQIISLCSKKNICFYFIQFILYSLLFSSRNAASSIFPPFVQPISHTFRSPMQFVYISLSHHSSKKNISFDVYHLKAAMQKKSCFKILYESMVYDIPVLCNSCSYVF